LISDLHAALVALHQGGFFLFYLIKGGFQVLLLIFGQILLFLDPQKGVFCNGVAFLRCFKGVFRLASLPGHPGQKKMQIHMIRIQLGCFPELFQGSLYIHPIQVFHGFVVMLPGFRLEFFAIVGAQGNLGKCCTHHQDKD